MKNKIITLFLAGCMLFGMASCSDSKMQRELTDKELAKIAAAIPDYSNSGKQYDFFAYSAASDGYWSDYGVEYYCGEDLRTVEQFTMYKDAGFTFMHPQGKIAIQPNDVFVYESSALKRLLDTAQEAGIDKVIVPDYRFNALISSVSKGCAAAANETFATFTDTYEVFTDAGELDQTALENVIKSFMGEYSTHPSFYGIIVKDEPTPDLFVGYGHVYRAVKRVYPDAYTLCNILPPAGFNTEKLDELVVSEETLSEFADASDQSRLAAWKTYITAFLDETQLDYLMYDQYPIGTNFGLHSTYIRALQVAAEVCKERNIDFCFVSQTCAIGHTKLITAKRAAWLNNTLLGMGVKTIGYFTYFDRSSTTNESYTDGGGFVTHFGEKTNVYDVMQKVMAQNQKMAPTLLSFDYQTSAVYVADQLQYPGQYITNSISTTQYAKVSSVTVDKESVLVSELLDKQNGRYMYMVQNIVDPDFTGYATYQTTTLTFNESYKYALVLSEGEQTVVKLVNDQYSITQHPGKAVYVIPFNA